MSDFPDDIYSDRPQSPYERRLSPQAVRAYRLVDGCVDRMTSIALSLDAMCAAHPDTIDAPDVEHLNQVLIALKVATTLMKKLEKHRAL